MKIFSKQNLIAAALAAPVLGLALLVSFGLANIGEPQALWLWRDILGVIQ